MQVVVGGATVQTVAVDGAVRFTTYWAGVTLPPPGADQLTWMLEKPSALAVTEVGTPMERAVDVPEPVPPGAQAATAAVAPRARKLARKHTARRLTSSRTDHAVGS